MDYYRLCINCMHLKKDPWDVCPYCGYDPDTYEPSSQALKPYTILNEKYILGKKLGAGGFGITYLAYDKDLDIPVAVKEFFMRTSMYRDSRHSTAISIAMSNRSDEQIYRSNKDRFKKEAQLLAKLGSIPGIVTVHNYFEQNNTAYIVMEYLEGRTLRQYVRDHGGQLPYRDILKMIRPVLESLKQLHDYQIFHRDISPDNLMVLKNGTMKLYDFGGARVNDEIHEADTCSHFSGPDRDEEESDSSIVLVKKGFSPYEQYCRGLQGPWTDEYALAATLYFCITGRTPVEATSRVMSDELTAPSVYTGDLPVSVENAVLKGMAIRREDRYPDLAAFEEALYTQFDESPPSSRKSFEGQLSKMITSALSGNVEAQNTLGNWYAEGKFIERNAGIAVKWYTDAAAQGYAPAQKNLGDCLYTGNGVAMDKKAALSWYKKAAEQGYRPAMERLWDIREVYRFQSRTVEEMVRTALGKAEGEAIYSDELTEITSLNLNGKNSGKGDIEDLSDLAHMVNLKELWLSFNRISDISPLAGLTSLVHLELESNNITDLTPLGRLTSLTILDLDTNSITSVTPLGSLLSLTHLNLRVNGITDISPLANLKALTVLDLDDNNITDITPLGQLTGLTSLGLNYNEVSDITALGRCKALTGLDLSRNSITDITPLRSLTSLDWLDLCSNNISDVSPLRRLKSLTTLWLADNPVNDISVLDSLKSLKVFT